MKTLLLTLALMAIAMPSYAQMDHSKMDMSGMDHSDHDDHEMSFKQVKNEMVCMVNDKAFTSPQIPVEVEGQTYYGCCSMCETRLQKDATIRKAVDPVSGLEVDKATAIIGAGPDGIVKYFENEENLNKYAMDQM